jgi:PAS domain S-box-containing protein
MVVLRATWRPGYIAKAMRGEPQEFEWALVLDDGRQLDTEVALKRIDVDGEDVLLITVRDVTERKQVERALRLTQFTVDHAPDTIFWVRQDGTIEWVNDAACALLGYDRAALEGRRVWDIDDDETPEQFAAGWARLREAGVLHHERVHTRADGTRVAVEIATRLHRFDGREVACSFCRDITQRRAADAEIALRRRYEHAVTSCSRALLNANDAGRAVPTALRHLLEVTGCGRAYVFENFREPARGLCMRQRFEVCASGAAPEIDNPELQALPYADGFELIRAALSDGQPFQATISELPTAARDLLAAQQIEAVLVLPIVVHGRWWGFLGFDELEQARRWNAADVRILQVAAEMIGAALSEQQVRGRMREKNAQLALALKQQRSTSRELQAALESLEASNQQLAAQAQELEQRQVELSDLNDELEIAISRTNRFAQEAAVASASKSQFLANMSHEIRTPMTAITGFAELLNDETRCCGQCGAQDDCGRREAGQKYVSAILRNGQHLLALINDILDLSKIEAGRFETLAVSCRPAEIIEEVIETLSTRARERELDLSVEYPGPIPQTIITDATRLRQILVNLVGNAIKFTERGSVRVIVTLQGDETTPRLELAVHDTGIGIAPQDVPHLFEPFTQADTSATRRFGGTGLGLSISQRLAQLLGGDIAVESTVGQGSVFRVTVATGSLEGIPLVTPEGAAASVPTTPSAPADAAPLTARILLAEDGPDNQRLIARLLERAGAQVVVVDDGAQAVAAAGAAFEAGEPFDVILMDMQMPVCDGYKATTQLREVGYNRPIIALTAHAMDGDREKCLWAGCDDFATKPVQRQALIEMLQRWAGRTVEIRLPDTWL